MIVKNRTDIENVHSFLSEVVPLTSSVNVFVNALFKSFKQEVEKEFEFPFDICYNNFFEVKLSFSSEEEADKFMKSYLETTFPCLEFSCNAVSLDDEKKDVLTSIFGFSKKGVYCLVTGYKRIGDGTDVFVTVSSLLIPYLFVVF